MLKRSIDDLFHNEITAWVVLAVSLFLTAVAWYLSNEYVERRAADRFSFEVEDSRQRILQRMLEYEQVLRGGIALFKASDDVTRVDWHHYVTALKIERYFPGIQGIGFSKVVAPEDKQKHEEEIRSEGFPEYAIRPASERPLYSSIVYLEPFDWRNKRAFGFDMLSEPTRNKAMTLAAKSGMTAVSGKMTLVQETDTDVQAGFLMYLPLYRLDESALTSIETRRQALIGYVYSAFRMDDLMEGILGSAPVGLGFEIYDHGVNGDEATADALLYESSKATPLANAKFNTVSLLQLPNREWSIHFHSLPGFESQASNPQPMIIAISGIAVDLLLFTIIFSLSLQKKRMHEKNAQLIQAENQRKSALKQLEQMAFFDSLTQLPNRRMLFNNIKQSSAMSQRDGLFRALLFIDLDKFKPVNDTYGHDVGDRLLVDVAARLVSTVREVDTVCRYAGDEFVILLENLSGERHIAEAQAETVAEKLRVSLSSDYPILGMHIKCSASIGIILFSGQEQEGDELLQLADKRMYEAKRLGGNRINITNLTAGSESA